VTSIVQFFFTVTVSRRQSSAMLVLPCGLYSSCLGREIQNWSTSKQHPKFRSSDLQWRILALVITGRQSATCVVPYIPYGVYGLWPHSTLPLIFRPWQRQDKGKKYCLWFLPLKRLMTKMILAFFTISPGIFTGFVRYSTHSTFVTTLIILVWSILHFKYSGKSLLNKSLRMWSGF